MTPGVLPSRAVATPRRIAAVVSVAFIVFGALWILGTDLALYHWVHDPTAMARLQTSKEWVFVAAGAGVLYWITVRSVRPMRRAEETLRAVLDSIADGVFLVDSEGRIVGANPAALRLLGVGSERDLEGVDPPEFSRRFHIRYPDGTLVPLPGSIVRQALHGQGSTSYKAVLTSTTGEDRVVTSSAAPVRPSSDEPVWLAVSVMHDITALDALDQLRGRLFARAAHAFKTPLSIIRGRAQLLGRASHLAEAQRAAAAIERQCGRLERLVVNALTLARIRDGTLRLHLVEAELAPIVDGVVHAMNGASSEHEVIEAPGAPALVYVDPERLALVLSNMIEVAFDRATPGSEVCVLTERWDHRARCGVRYRPANGPRSEPTGLANEIDPRRALEVLRHVNEHVIDEFHGTSAATRSDDLVTDWLDLPRSEERHRAAP